jgi:hypothetical protein
MVDGRLVDKATKEKPVGVLTGSNMLVSGKTASLLAPSIQSSQEVIANCVRNAGIAPTAVDFVDGHLPGAFLGDVVEVSAIMRVHRGGEYVRPLNIGSVKSMTANTYESGGISSLCKVMFAQQWSLMQPNLHLRELNPNMDTDDMPMFFSTECLEYPMRHSFSGVMSQGVGGSNVYMIAWGAMDDEKVHSWPEFELNQQQVLYWPGGGGSLEPEAQPRDGYYLIGSWNEWSNPDSMERESDGVYGYTLTLGVNGWESFQIILDQDQKRVLHPGFAAASRESAVLGPDEDAEGTWMIDARCDLYGLPPEESAAIEGDGAAAAEGGEVTETTGGADRIVSVGTVDMGKPGDKYRIRLRIQGKWRSVDWEKVEDAPEGAALPESCVGRYFLCASWNAWTFEDLPPVPEAPGTFRKEVKLLRQDGGSFQIARNRDYNQMLYPGADGQTVGPDEWGDGTNWFLNGKIGDVFSIELQREQDNSSGYDLKSVDFKLLRNEALTKDERRLADYPLYTILGSWSRHKELMTFDLTDAYYKAKFAVGSTGMESFQILQDGAMATALYPSVPDANPSVPHSILGPQPGGLGYNWTIGGTAPEDQKAPGALFEVRLHIFLGRPQKVEWVQLAA